MSRDPVATPARPADAGVPGAREIAAHVLARVERDGAFATLALDAEVRRWPQLDPREIGLATELVYGVLRTRGFLETHLSRLSSKGSVTLEGEARGHLLAGAYAIAFLERVPVFASVDEAVAGASRHAGPRVGGFVNALLRGLAREVEAKGRPPMDKAVADGAPGWLRGALRRSLGRSGASAFLAAGPVPAPLGLAIRAGADRDDWIERIRAAAPATATIEPGLASPRAILVRGAGDPRRLPGCDVDWIAQEEGAQVLALLTGARPGERVLDACAGRGNKAWILADDVGPDGAVVAADLHARKLDALLEGPLRGRIAATHAVDWSLGTADVPGGFDRALVDAPCSGVGTLRRRPEIAWARAPDDVPRLADLQVAIARSAATRVRDGGVLVYAVCSVLTEECEGVVERLAALGDAAGRPLTPAALPRPDPTRASLGDRSPTIVLAEGATQLRLLPHVHGTDGYFLAAFHVGVADGKRTEA